MQIFLHNLDGSQSVINICEGTTLESLLLGSCGTRLVYQGAILNSLESLCDIKMVNPYAVDVSGGVENSPGKKDLQKMKLFVQAVRQHT